MTSLRAHNRTMKDIHDTARAAMADLIEGIARTAPDYEGLEDLRAEGKAAALALADFCASAQAAGIELATGLSVRRHFPKKPENGHTDQAAL
ncbi:hypothetical protein [uncultured Martelella sp.]|uniref:hypothetical protein n=1 Tax=uncultured Martelella sp. TaxID=392331 RepID=UPI0029C6380E|nr:hypothetical protein [uncultured Martelella sp.]